MIGTHTSKSGFPLNYQPQSPSLTPSVEKLRNLEIFTKLLNDSCRLAKKNNWVILLMAKIWLYKQLRQLGLVVFLTIHNWFYES